MPAGFGSDVHSDSLKRTVTGINDEDLCKFDISISIEASLCMTRG